MGVYLIREVADSLECSDGDEAAMVDVIERLRDEVSVLAVRGHAQQSRELALILTKLDEARLWAMAFSIKMRSHLFVDKRKYAHDLEATADMEPRTVPTVPTVTGGEI